MVRVDGIFTLLYQASLASGTDGQIFWGPSQGAMPQKTALQCCVTVTCYATLPPLPRSEGEQGLPDLSRLFPTLHYPSLGLLAAGSQDDSLSWGGSRTVMVFPL